MIWTKKKGFKWLPFVDIDFRNMCFMAALESRMCAPIGIMQFMVAEYFLRELRNLLLTNIKIFKAFCDFKSSLIWQIFWMTISLLGSNDQCDFWCGHGYLLQIQQYN